MSDATKTAKRVVRGLSAIAMAVEVHVDVEHEEVDRFAVFGAPVFYRDPGTGRPRVLGVPFPRWIRGPRREKE